MKVSENSTAAQAASPVKIAVIGVGGGGSNAVNNMIASRVNVTKYIAVNTDLQALKLSKAQCRLQIGSKLTKGFGAGAKPDLGEKAASESKAVLTDAIRDMDLVFITAGMGGGTGTGAAPIIAAIAQELGKLTIAFVTKPFEFEGAVRMRNAEMGLQKLREHVDSIVVIPNERLMSVAKNLTTADAFKYADDVLRQGIQSVTDIIINPKRINIDFADIISILKDGGDAYMGIGRKSGENRAVEAIKEAVNNPLLGTTIEGATGVILSIEGKNVLLQETNEAARLVREICDKDVNMIFGTDMIDYLQDDIQVTIIATGFGKKKKTEEQAIQPRQTAILQTAAPQSAQQLQQPVQTSMFSRPQPAVQPQPVIQPQPQPRNNGRVDLEDSVIPDYLKHLYRLSNNDKN